MRILIFNYHVKIEFWMLNSWNRFHFISQIFPFSIQFTFLILFRLSIMVLLCALCVLNKRGKKVNIFSGFSSFIFWSHPPSHVSLPCFLFMYEGFRMRMKWTLKAESSKKNERNRFIHSLSVLLLCYYIKLWKRQTDEENETTDNFPCIIG